MWNLVWWIDSQQKLLDRVALIAFATISALFTSVSVSTAGLPEAATLGHATLCGTAGPALIVAVLTVGFWFETFHYPDSSLAWEYLQAWRALNRERDVETWKSYRQVVVAILIGMLPGLLLGALYAFAGAWFWVTISVCVLLPVGYLVRRRLIRHPNAMPLKSTN